MTSGSFSLHSRSGGFLVNRGTVIQAGKGKISGAGIVCHLPIDANHYELNRSIPPGDEELPKIAGPTVGLPG